MILRRSALSKGRRNSTRNDLENLEAAAGSDWRSPHAALALPPDRAVSDTPGLLPSPCTAPDVTSNGSSFHHSISSVYYGVWVGEIFHELESKFRRTRVRPSGQLSTAEREVTRFFQQNREEVLIASAASLASKIGTSNATVVRTALALGYSSLADMRRQLADEIRADLSPASRLERTLGSVGDVLEAAFHSTLAIHVEVLENLRRNVSPALFASAVTRSGPHAEPSSSGSVRRPPWPTILRCSSGASASRPTRLRIPDFRSRMISTAFVAATWSLSWPIRVYLELDAVLTASPMFVQRRSLSPIHWLRHSGTAWT